MNKNRCGAKGVLEGVNGKYFFVVRELITVLDYNKRLKLFLEEDMSVGERIPLGDLVHDHRGIVIYDGVNIYLDEGEFRSVGAINDFVFVSDYEGPLSDATAFNLCILPYTFQIKPEIYDQIGAFRRLKQSKQAFRK